MEERRKVPAYVSCVYCGMEYPSGTPPHGSQVQTLTDHIKVCEKHPLRKAEVTIAKLKSALEGLVGESDKDELVQMESDLHGISTIVGTSDAINAIRVLIELNSE